MLATEAQGTQGALCTQQGSNYLQGCRVVYCKVHWTATVNG
jgi:hypothetical protein